jgi:hypothetical protein
MQGEKSFQISGAVREIASKGGEIEGEDAGIAEGQITSEENDADVENLAEQDIGLVAEQAKVSREAARKALEESSGDIAGAILKAGKGSEYSVEIGTGKDLIKFIANVKNRELKEKAPLLYEANLNDQLKAVHALHSLGKDQIGKMMRDESKETRQTLKGRLSEIIANCTSSEKTLIKQDLSRKAEELYEWIGN